MRFIRIIKANQKVYHGSPYKFDNFDQSKISFGDGNKYGWGVYFTADTNFANSYGSGKEYYDGKQIGIYESLIIPDLMQGKKKEIIKEYKDFKPEVAEFARNFDPSKYQKNKGFVYICSIPDTDKLIDWDSRIDEQPLHYTLKLIAKENNIDINDNPFGSQFYIRLANKFDTNKQASLELLKYEIPGLTYKLNHQNFVIWDSSKIKILEIK